MGTDYTATAEVTVTLEVTWEKKDNVTNYRPQVKDWSGRVTNVRFKEAVVRPLQGLAKDAANDWLQKEKNKNDLRDKANKAFDDAFKAGRLREVSDGE